eukprot:13170204-Ditylum_brightwellii.AAC.1
MMTVHNLEKQQEHEICTNVAAEATTKILLAKREEREVEEDIIKTNKPMDKLHAGLHAGLNDEQKLEPKIKQKFTGDLNDLNKSMCVQKRKNFL